MWKQSDFDYAIENTRILRVPTRRIATFGDTRFKYQFLSELMDEVDKVRVRSGEIHAQRPSLITPQTLSKLLLEGFGEETAAFAEWLTNQGPQLTVLKYGFQIRKIAVADRVITAPIEQAIEMVSQEVSAREDSLEALIYGVDDAWEVCLLKFTVDIIQRSASGNLRDFRQDGLI